MLLQFEHTHHAKEAGAAATLTSSVCPAASIDVPALLVMLEDSSPASADAAIARVPSTFNNDMSRTSPKGTISS
jgi:hypothetical protein